MYFIRLWIKYTKLWYPIVKKKKKQCNCSPYCSTCVYLKKDSTLPLQGPHFPIDDNIDPYNNIQTNTILWIGVNWLGNANETTTSNIRILKCKETDIRILSVASTNRGSIINVIGGNSLALVFLSTVVPLTALMEMKVTQLSPYFLRRTSYPSWRPWLGSIVCPPTWATHKVGISLPRLGMPHPYYRWHSNLHKTTTDTGRAKNWSEREHI